MDILSNVTSAIFHQKRRQIGLMVPDVVVSEKHTDTLTITEHPVEKGASITDHAYKNAAEVTMQVGFAAGGSLLDFTDTQQWSVKGQSVGLGLSPQEAYQKLIDLQSSREPFDVMTGKRTYHNCLIRSLEVTTEPETENVLMCTITLRELIISETAVAQVADKSKMRFGVSTSAVQNTGVKAPVPVNESVLKKYLAAGK